MEALALRVGQALKRAGLSAVTAESCTGGWVAQAITSVPGSSAWFVGGYVSYADSAKQRMLGVQAKTLEHYGAVSEAVAVEMAEGALRNSDADISVSISGVAGPDGGSDEKPVGTVWFAWAVKGRPTVSCLSFFHGDRESVRRQAVEQALEGLIAYLPD
ncbi:CinA family protein [Marinobacterium sp. D7]|uniref:CinA family protein n=1 Tax=Marinobacterium ramblicola TaxID=2849041 RepID=UPI001C2DD294|nr:CinA family protein [Marinobacterium ramblicola]MBV1788836.1 CinA family protein [Marinobacterium ramblicola]